MALRRPRSKGKTLGGCLTLVAVIAAILLFGPFVRNLVDTPFNPWAHSWRGGPTLTGTWVGAAASPSGQRAGLFLDLRRAEKNSRRGGYSTCRTCPRIKGQALMCGGPQVYEVWGSPDTWGGERFHLKVTPLDQRQPGPRLGYVTGEWGGDAMSLSMTLEHGGGQGAGAEVRFEMRRGTEAEFLDACRKSGADWN